MEQADVSYERAARLYTKHSGDIVNAIMEAVID